MDAQIVPVFVGVLKNNKPLLSWEFVSFFQIGTKTKHNEKIRGKKCCWKVAT
jgi:hypothetical protein